MGAKVMLKKPTASDGKKDEVSTTDVRISIMLNNSSLEYQNVRKFSEVA